jgi:tetratricopeptide (TPR) repeat protein
MRRVHTFLVLGTLAAAVAIGCQSVATTSAKLRNQEGNYDLAIKLANEALASNPNDAEAHFQLGVSYSYLDSVALAYHHYVKAKTLDPEKTTDADNNIQHNFAKHYKLGQSAFNRQDLKTAAVEFGLATKADPKQSVAYYNLGVAYSRLALQDPALHAQALAAADKVLELSNPSEANYTKALQLAGRELVAMDREEEAAGRFKRLIEEDPASYKVIEDIGNDELNSKNYASAAVFLKMAAEARAKVGADDANVYYNIGVALYNLRREDPAKIDEAISYYQRALDITPDTPDIVFNIYVAYVAKEDWANSAQWGEKYVSLNPGDANGWKLLARSYTELGDNDKATEAIKRFEMLSQ